MFLAKIVFVAFTCIEVTNYYVFGAGQVDDTIPEDNEEQVEEERTPPDQYTYVALIDIVFTDGRKRVCTGAIIQDNVVITAAHCFRDHENSVEPELTASFVVIGTKKMFETGYENYLPIERVLTHPKYRGWTANLALVFTFSGMTSDKPGNVIPLVGERTLTPVDSNVTILSWGHCKDEDERHTRSPLVIDRTPKCDSSEELVDNSCEPKKYKYKKSQREGSSREEVEQLASSEPESLRLGGGGEERDTYQTEGIIDVTENSNSEKLKQRLMALQETQATDDIIDGTTERISFLSSEEEKRKEVEIERDREIEREREIQKERERERDIDRENERELERQRDYAERHRYHKGRRNETNRLSADEPRGIYSDDLTYRGHTRDGVDNSTTVSVNQAFELKNIAMTADQRRSLMANNNATVNFGTRRALWRRQMGSKLNTLTIETFGFVNVQTCKKMVERSLTPFYQINPNNVVCYAAEDHYITDEDAGAPAVRQGHLIAVTIGGVSCDGDHVAIGMKMSCFCPWIAENLPHGAANNMKCCEDCCDTDNDSAAKRYVRKHHRHKLGYF